MNNISIPNRKTAFIISAVILFSYIFYFTIIPLKAVAASTSNIDLGSTTSVFLYNIENKYVILEKDTDKKISPVATAKIMAGLVAVEALSERLDESITITQAMIDNVKGQYYGLKAGGTATVRDLLYMAFCAGYNDAISIICYLLGGEASFVNQMNLKAISLEMTSTFYTNATGITDANMYTTVNDVAKLSLAALDSSLLMEVTSADKYTTEGLTKNDYFYNRNCLLGTGRDKNYYNPLCRGLAAGYTVSDGHCVATIADNGDLSYLCIVMGADTDKTAYTLANKLINHAYDAYGYRKIISAEDIVCEMPVSMSLDVDTVLVVPESDATVYLPKSLVMGSDLTKEYKLTVEELRAPVIEGTVVGFITVYYGDEELYTVRLITKTSVAQSEILMALEWIRELTKSRFFIATVISCVIISIVYIVVRSVFRATSNKHYSRYRR